MRTTSKLLRNITQISIVAILGITTSCGSAGFLGLQDYQRDFLFGAVPALLSGGALAVSLLSTLTGTTGGSPSPSPVPGPEGPAGPAGADGAPGPQLFDVFVEDYFTTNLDASAKNLGGLTVEVVQITEPVIGLTAAQAGQDERVAYRVLVPRTYQGANPVVMRLALRRQGGTIGGTFSFNVYGRRLTDGSGTIEDYINPPMRTFTPTAPVSETEYMVLDLPVNVATFDGLGGAALAAGQLLAFELETATSDGGEYLLLGVEFYETQTSPAAGNLGGVIS